MKITPGKYDFELIFLGGGGFCLTRGIFGFLGLLNDSAIKRGNSARDFIYNWFFDTFGPSGDYIYFSVGGILLISMYFYFKKTKN